MSDAKRPAAIDGGAPMVSLERHIHAVQNATLHHPSGVVVEVVGLLVEVGGLKAGVGDILQIADGRLDGKPSEHATGGPAGALDLEVIGFRAGRLVATPLGSVAGVRPGARVVRLDRGTRVGVGDALLGRIVDAFGRPLDAGASPDLAVRYPVRAAPPPPVARKPITRVFSTGIRAIDALLTLGCGQRVGIFAGAGVGKSTLLGMICRASTADVNVIGLVGERGREVNDFVRGTLGTEGLARSVVVAATSDQPPLVRARGAETATAIAEYFRDQGKSVLLVMDSVTRYAMAQREAALATGEPPATKGYPPSVFAALPRLLERAGTASGAGTITALYTVLVEGDELTDPVADAVRSILDGHIVLSRSLAERGHLPAIDVLQSVSRLAPNLMSAPQARHAAALRDLLATRNEAMDLVRVGAYVAGSDPRVDAALRVGPAIDTMLRQGTEERTPMDKTLEAMRSLAASVGVA